MTFLTKIRQIEKRHNVRFYIPRWSESRFQERLMRFGVEFKKLGLESAYDANTEGAIIESFAKDLFERVEGLPEGYSSRDIQGIANHYRS